MSFFNIALVQPPGYVHSMALHEIGLLLYHTLDSLGHGCRYQANRLEPQATNILLGYQLLSSPDDLPSGDLIIYQLEQLSDREGWFHPRYLEIFRRAREVWDYSAENIAFLKTQGIENVKHVPIGFHEKLQTIRPQTQDIDALFYGSVNPRRQAILDQLAKQCHVKVLFGTYGEERDQYIARSKIVLNIHFYEAQIMEQPRIAYLLNNRRFVLSEHSANHPFGEGLTTVEYRQLVDACISWLERSEARQARADHDFELFRRQPMIETVNRILTNRRDE